MSLFKGIRTTNKADKISNFQSTSCDFGTPLPLAYGTCKLSPNLINYQDFTTTKKKTTTKSGKAKTTNIDYEYSVYIELALCEGPIGGINKIWVGDTKYNSLAEFNTAKDATGTPLMLNVGDNNSPTTYMQTNHPDIACGYNNMAFLYGFVSLGINTASCPSYQVEVKGLCRVNNAIKDANPADVIQDMLSRIGLGSYCDAVSFANYKAYCTATDLLISTPADLFGSQTSASDVIKTILDLTNAYMFWSVDRFKIIPRDDRQHGSWSPNKTVLYDLTKDDLCKQSDGSAIVIFKYKDTSEIYNRFGLTFTNRDNDYEAETVFFEDTEDIAVNGVKSNSTIDGRWFHTKERAIKAVEMAARVNRIETVEYQFYLDWALGERLEPGDLVTLTDENIGIVSQPVMVKSVTFDRSGKANVKAVRREPGNYSAAVIDVHENDYNYIDLNVQPSDTKVPIFITPPPALTSGGMELWIALQGEDETWGGCQVYVSDKDSEYSLNGIQDTSSSMGAIVSSISADADAVTVQFFNSNTVELMAGTEEDANNRNTLLWINGEIVAYSSSTLVSANRYTFGGLKRGQYNTLAVSHDADASVVVLDANLFSISLPAQYADREMFFKFPAFNELQRNVQDLAEVDAYSTVIVNNNDAVSSAELSYNYYNSSTTNDLINEAMNTPPDYWDFVVENYVSDDKKNWYRLYQSGWVEQGGTTISTTSDALEVSLVKPMADTNYYVNWLVNGSHSDSNMQHGVSKYPSYFVLRDYTLNATTATWYACGYALKEFPADLTLNVTKYSDNPVQTITTTITVDGASVTYTGNQSGLTVPYGATVKVYTGKNDRVLYNGERWRIWGSKTGNIIFNGEDKKAVNYQWRMTENVNITTTAPQITVYSPYEGGDA